jgi:hypothetical protein
MSLFSKIVVAFSLLISLSAKAHPVTFEGGTALYTVLRPSMSKVQINYSLSSKYALGLSYRRYKLGEEQIEVGHPQMNVLAWRHNGDAGQANLYLLSGVGYGQNKAKKQGFFYWLGAQTDYETRTFYTAFKAQVFKFREQEPYGLQYRLGVSPYEAEYDELQSWIIGQIDYFPQMSSRIKITPMMRFFYQNALWEIGASIEGHIWLQLMAHF